jgi:hypothetical protein
MCLSNKPVSHNKILDQFNFICALPAKSHIWHMAFGFQVSGITLPYEGEFFFILFIFFFSVTFGYLLSALKQTLANMNNVKVLRLF